MPPKKPYIPEHYADLYAEPQGQALWEYFNEHDTLIRMDTATFLNRPACEPLVDDLLARFSELMTKSEAARRSLAAKKRHDRLNQMIGHMIRQVMEAHGYLFDQPRVRIKSRDFFTSGARYKKVPRN
ncbi:hypothetical protein KDL45_16260 [bacterium]|nr:hypothetical protein [bacterium]